MEEENFNQRKEKGDIKENIKAENRDKVETPQEKWNEAAEVMEHEADVNECEIDDGAKETVVALYAFGINTTQSCEGHIDHGFAVPWLMIAAPKPPEEFFIGEKATLEEYAKKHGVTVDDLKKKEEYEDVLKEAMLECMKNGKTKETFDWEEKTRKIKLAFEEILADYYKGREISSDLKMKFVEMDYFGGFRVFIGSERDYYTESDDLGIKEKQELEERLKVYQEEMKKFGQFLKEKFFKEGAGYVNDMISRVQKEIDQKKITKIKEKLEINS